MPNHRLPIPICRFFFVQAHYRPKRESAAWKGGAWLHRKACPLVQQSTASKNYRVDSISNPQASSRASGMYFEFLFRRAHSRSLVERIY
jgi:hypothetical protein